MRSPGRRFSRFNQFPSYNQGNFRCLKHLSPEARRRSSRIAACGKKSGRIRLFWRRYRFSVYGPAYAAAYVFYSAPAVTVAGQPKREGSPDRWGAFSARGGGLLLYALFDLLPFVNADQSAAWQEAVEITADSGQSYSSFDEALSRIVLNMELLAPTFFRGEAGDPMVKQAFLEDFAYFTPAPLRERHRAVAPDFFAWLGQ
jgi:hypothetical protein